MRSNILLTVVFIAAFTSCKKHKTGTVPAPIPVKPVLLKEIVVPNLPSPYYHFEYNTSDRIAHASFAAGIRLYDVLYTGTKITELFNNTTANKDRLQYIYNDAGKAEIIRYINKDGVLFRRCFLTYTGAQLRTVEWERKVNAGFAIERTMAFVYQADGNLLEMTDHLHQIDGQNEATYTIRFEQYDDKINTDAFRLLHEDNDHLLLLPGVELQKNNPGKLTRSGNGSGYTITYSYTYNERKAPLTKTGDVVITEGPNAGQRFQTNSFYSYY